MYLTLLGNHLRPVVGHKYVKLWRHQVFLLEFCEQFEFFNLILSVMIHTFDILVALIVRVSLMKTFLEVMIAFNTADSTYGQSATLGR